MVVLLCAEATILDDELVCVVHETAIAALVNVITSYKLLFTKAH